MKISGIAAVCLLSTQFYASAQQNSATEAPAPLPNSAPALKVDEQHQRLSIGDVAPEQNLTVFTPMSAMQGNTRDYLGKRAVQLLIITPDYATHSSGKFLSGSSELEALWNTSDTPFVFVAGVSAKNAKPIPLLLHGGKDKVTYVDDGGLAQRYNQSSPGMTLVAIDRAGFIRRIDKVTDGAKQIRAQILQVGDPTPKVEVGKVAPDFSMMDMNGIVRRLSDLRGKKNLLLTFFPKCFTGGCTNHLTSIQKENLSYLASETETWAVSVDPAEGEKGQLAFAARWGFQFPLIPDEGRNLSILYGAAENPQQLASRMSVLIDKDGIVRLIDKNVDVYTHGSDIILQMRQLGMIPTAPASK